MEPLDLRDFFLGDEVIIRGGGSSGSYREGKIMNYDIVAVWKAQQGQFHG